MDFEQYTYMPKKSKRMGCMIHAESRNLYFNCFDISVHGQSFMERHYKHFQEKGGKSHNGPAAKLPTPPLSYLSKVRIGQTGH